jgi:hypothetical protein
MALSTFDWLMAGICVLAMLFVSYFVWVNHLLKGVPSDVRRLSGPRWTAEQFKRAYRELDEQLIDYRRKLPPSGWTAIRDSYGRQR